MGYGFSAGLAQFSAIESFILRVPVRSVASQREANRCALSTSVRMTQFAEQALVGSAARMYFVARRSVNDVFRQRPGNLEQVTKRSFVI
jgi:hypothetical protein